MKTHFIQSGEFQRERYLPQETIQNKPVVVFPVKLVGKTAQFLIVHSEALVSTFK